MLLALNTNDFLYPNRDIRMERESIYKKLGWGMLMSSSWHPVITIYFYDLKATREEKNSYFFKNFILHYFIKKETHTCGWDDEKNESFRDGTKRKLFIHHYSC